MNFLSSIATISTSVSLRLSLALALMSVLVGCESKEEERAATNEPTPLQDDALGSHEYQVLKQLIGSWRGTRNGAPVNATYELLSQGHAITERLEFPDIDQNVITVFYVDHGRLRATHYCRAGNQPTFVARKGKNEGSFAFQIANLDDVANEHHVHRIDMDVSELPEKVTQIRQFLGPNGGTTNTFVFTRIKDPMDTAASEAAKH